MLFRSTLARFAAAVWSMTTLGYLFLTLTSILNVPITDSFDKLVIKSFLFQTALGKSFLITFIASVFVNVLLLLVRKNGSVFLIMCLAFIGIFAPVFQAHSSSSGSHGLATGSLIFHVFFITLWLGGVIGLIVIAPNERQISLPRFSAIAF